MPNSALETRRHQRVVHAIDRERCDGEPVAGLRSDVTARSEHMDAADGTESVVQPCGERRLVGPDGVPADPLQLVHGRPEGDGADDVGGPGLLPLRWLGPDDLVEVDQVDGAAAGEEGVARLERPPRCDQRAGSERRVELVAAEGHEVRSRRQRSVRGELGGVEQDRDAACVRLLTDLVDRGQPTGDVRRSRQGQQRRGPTIGEDADDVVGAEGPVGAALDPAP